MTSIGSAPGELPAPVTLAGSSAPFNAAGQDCDGLENLAREAWTARQTLAAFAALLAFALVAASLWRIGGAVVPWDSKNEFYPNFRFLGQAFQHGEIPLWNPFHFAGYPSVADPQSLLFSPTMAFFAWLAPQASMAQFDLFVYAHLLIGGLGVIGLIRRRGWAPAAAVLAGVIFIAGGSASARLQHTGMILSYGFFPLAFWALDALLEAPSLRQGAAFGLAAALMAVGRDQVAFLFCLFLAAWFAWKTARSGDPLAFLRARAAPLLGAAAVCGGLLFVPIVLTLQFLHDSNRPGIPLAIAFTGSLDPANFITFIAPDFFGSIDKDFSYFGPGGGADWTDRCIDYLYVGALAPVLLLWHGLAGGRFFARGARFFAAVIAFAIAYALGRFTPLFDAIYHLIPGVSFYRRPADATFLLNFCIALSSGFLLDRFITLGRPKFSWRWGAAPRRISAPITLALVAFVLYSGVRFAAGRGDLAHVLAPLAVGLFWTALCVVALILPRGEKSRRMAAAALVALTAGQLLWRNADSGLNGEARADYAVYGQMPASSAAGLALLEKDIAARQAAGARPRVEILGLDGPWQNASMVFNLEDTIGYNPLRIDDYDRLVGAGDNAADDNLRHFPKSFASYTCQLARLLGLEYLVVDKPLARLPKPFARQSYSPIYVGGKMVIYQLGPAAPRAYVAHEAVAAPTAMLMRANALPLFDSRSEALLDPVSLALVSARVSRASAHPSQTDAQMLAEAAQDRTRILDYDDDRVTLAVNSPRGGLLVLHDLYYPGWIVTVNGARKPLLRANGLFRGVEVGPGQSTVEFIFRPFSLENLLAAARGALNKAG